VQNYSLAATQSSQLAAGPVFPNVLSTQPAAGLSALSVQFAAPNFSTPYSEQASFAVEREVMHNLTVTASYLWSRGIHLYSVRDLNLPTTSTPYTYAIQDNSGNALGSYSTQVLTGSRPNTAFGGIYQDENGVTSFYNALTLQVRKRLSHGFIADLSYTWSHEIDDGQGYGQSTSNLFLSNNFSWLVNGDYKQDRGKWARRSAPASRAVLGLGAHNHSSQRRSLYLFGEQLAALLDYDDQ
jgi:hypothetical protein